MKRTHISGIGSLIVVVAVSAVLIGCGADQAAAPEPDAPAQPSTAAVIEQEELETIEVPQLDHAMITFVTGDAWLEREGNEFLADIGDFLQPGEVLSVDTGYVELQAGELGTVRVEEETTIRLDDIVIAPGGSSFDLRVVSGSVLNKVNRLAGNDTYEVRTETAVMGVRGTEFGVQVEEGEETLVAVREGRVALVPPAADPDVIRARAEESGVDAAVVEAAIRELEEQAPVLEPNQQASLDQADAERGQEAVAEIETAIAVIAEQVAAGADGDSQEVSAILASAAQTVAARVQAETAAELEEISAESLENLEAIDEIRTVPVAANTNGDESVAVALIPVRLEVEPADAVVWIGERVVGQGGFSGVFVPGEVLSFRIENVGFQPETLELTVEEERGRAYTVRLAPNPEPVPEEDVEIIETALLEVNAFPADAEILIDGQLIGSGTVEIERDPGSTVQVEVALDGFFPQSQEITLNANQEPIRFDLEPLPEEAIIAPLSISIEPAGATIFFDGVNQGQNNAEQDFEAGQRVLVRAVRPGFADLEQSVSIEAEGTSLQLQMDPRPVEATVRITGSSLVRGVVSDGQLAYLADRDGTVYAVNDGGQVVWSAATSNAGNENSIPVVAGGTVAFSGASEFVLLNARSGQVSARTALSGSSAHLFGRRAAAFGGQWFLPTDEVFQVYAATGGAGAQVAIPGGSKMSGAIAEGRLVVADQQGQVLIIDPNSGETLFTVATGMSQPIALAPAVQGSRAFVVGRRGVAVAVDSATGTLLWEQGLAGGQGTFVDPVVAGDSVLVFAGGRITALSTSDGSERYSLTNAAGPPVAVGTDAYYGTTDGRLVRLNGTSGSVISAAALPGTAAGAPTALGVRILVPLADGQLAVVHPDGMQ